jgi:hypothetical protein
MEFMTENIGEVLKHPVTHEEYKEKQGKSIYCISWYQSPKSLEQLQAAINKLHSYFSSTKGGVYHDGECTACNAMSNNGQVIGCNHHHFNPQIHHHGNTVTDPMFKSKLKHWKDFGKEPYNQKGNLQQIPKEVHDIHQYLLSQNSLVSFMIYVHDVPGRHQALLSHTRSAGHESRAL